MKFLKMITIMLVITAVTLSITAIVVLSRQDNAVAVTATLEDAPPEAPVDAQEAVEEGDAESIPDPDPSQVAAVDSSADGFDREVIYGTWEIFNAEDPDKITSRNTYREDGVIEIVQSPGTEYEKSYNRYYRIKADERYGFTLYTYEDQSSYDADETTAVSVIGDMSDSMLTMYTMIAHSGYVLRNQPYYMRKMD